MARYGPSEGSMLGCLGCSVVILVGLGLGLGGLVCWGARAVGLW